MSPGRGNSAQPGAMPSWVIAIDGPSGAGKSTVAKLLAQKLGYAYVDTGAIYRCVALQAQKERLISREFRQSSDEDKRLKKGELDIELTKLLAGFAKNPQAIAFAWHEGAQKVILNGQDVTQAIREEAVSQAASSLSGRPIVRERLLDFQRFLGRNGSVVLEGRDIGTVVFPKAEIKIFLVADVGERADRRCRELKGRGREVTLEAVRDAILERDRQDTERGIAPLKKAEDALEVDSTHLGIEQVVERILEIIKEQPSLKKNPQEPR